MKRSIFAVAIVLSVNAMATGTGQMGGMTIDQKANAIEAIRSEANAARETNRAMIDKFNNDRDNFTQQDTDAWDNATSVLKSAQSRLDAIYNAPTVNPQLDPAGHPVHLVAKTALVAAKPGQTSTINVAAGDLPHNTQVLMPDGKIVLAGMLPPTLQIAKPFTSAFTTQTRSSHADHTHATDEHGTGNGAENAQNSRSAGSFSTRNDAIGGGLAGGGFHY
ncbi:hypothetical protein GJV06_12985 [Enterobacteriaceae bacterium RIT691]|nr:hypothetical protein [Enterobacteriaceae bacterium RIT691]